MPGQIVLTEKLRRPEVTGLPRPRLERPVLAAPVGELVLVVAPPGSGKTTLLARISAAAGAPTAWYRVTSDDSTEPAFCAYLARALHDGLGAGTGTAERIDELLGSLDGWTGTGVMVLDDVHEIAGTPAEAVLEQFVSLRPPSVQLLIGSRRAPDLNIPRLRVSGALREITTDDLRFRSWEVEELFIGVFREPLAPEAAAALTRRTGGWAAGLQLFHLSTRTRSGPERALAVAALGGQSKLMRSYLARNVLAELAPARREFLLHTSTLGLLTGPLCDALLESTGSARILDELEDQQLFTSSDDDGRTFRYHEVLRAHLEAALAEEYGGEGARRWYDRSANLLEAAGHRQAAIRAFARAEDWPAVARLIQSDQRGSAGTAADVAELLPPGVVEHDPWLSLVDARRRLRNGSVQAAADAFRRARELLDEPGFRERCDHERAIALLWLPQPPPVARFVGEYPGYEWLAAIRQATRHQAGGPAGQATEPKRTTSSATSTSGALASGLVAMLVGDVRSATSTLSALVQNSATDPATRLAARTALAVAGIAAGTLRPATDLQAEFAEIAVEGDADGFGWIARLARGLGDAVLVATGAPAWRTAALEDLLMACDEAGDIWGAALLQLSIGVAAVIGGHPGAGAALSAASARFAALDAPVLQYWADAVGAVDAARRGAPDAARSARECAARAAAAEIRGAQALALAGAAVADPADREAAIRADGLAGICGLRPALLALLRTPEVLEGRPPGVSGSGAEQPPPPTGLEPESAGAPLPLQRTGTGLPDRPAAVRCFGGLAMEINGNIVDLAPMRPRSRTLLRILALQADSDVHRERLADLLWPDTDVAVATRRLQVAVSTARHALEQAGLPTPFGVVRHGDAYRLRLPPGSTVDVRDFEELLRAASTAQSTETALDLRTRALGLYTGELFPEEGPAEFVVGHRDRLRIAAAAAAASAAQDAAQLGRPREALWAARRSVELEPYQDLAWRLLADLHEQSGDGSAAEQVRRDHARAREELEGVF